MKYATLISLLFVFQLCAQAAANEVPWSEQGLFARTQNLVFRQAESAIQRNEILLKRPPPSNCLLTAILCGGVYRTDKPLTIPFLFCGTGLERFKPLLPEDPTPLLAESYLRCHSIRVSFLEPAVPVADYPEGHFGDYLYEDTLVTARINLTDETSLRQMFTLIVESLALGDDKEFFTEQSALNDAANYKEWAHFKPNLLIEFIGPRKLRVELDFTADQGLVRQDSKWGSYSLDKWSAAAIRALVQQEQSKTPGTSPSLRP